ncbi:MAG: outer membrane lipoprotein-sorting protein [Deltaproteobacteria bacterium]|nr:outer membrane lipoprotein-sorting protein [Deltaproteobacteria bacterium]
MSQHRKTSRKRQALMVLGVLGMLMVLGFPGVPGDRPLRAAEGGASQNERVKALMHKIDRLFRSESSHGVMTMAVKTERYSRTMKMEVWSRGMDQSLVKILAPKKDRGVATLKSGKNIWMYLPDIDKVTKIPSSMMGSSWMGSHFTNDDLVRDSSWEDDFTGAITFEGDRNGVPTIEVTLTPKPDAPVVWGKVVMEIHATGLYPLRALYYDEEMNLTRSMMFDDVKDVGGRKIPARQRVIPADKPQESTTIVYESMEFDQGVDEDMFSQKRLRGR